eukprot:4117916-Pleurochrysis_carterae.AAC.1
MRVTLSGSRTRAVYRVHTSNDRTILKLLDLSSWQPLFLHIIRSRLLVVGWVCHSYYEEGNLKRGRKAQGASNAS